METWRQSNIMGAILVIGFLVIVFRIGYNVGDPEVDWMGYPVPVESVESVEAAPERVECTLYEDGSVGCNASLVTENDWHVGGACIVPDWGCRD